MVSCVLQLCSELMIGHPRPVNGEAMATECESAADRRLTSSRCRIKASFIDHTHESFLKHAARYPVARNRIANETELPPIPFAS